MIEDEIPSNGPFKNCPVCGIGTRSRAEFVSNHFAFYYPGQFRYWRGNIKTFGFWSGLLASIYLSFPFVNILAHWKYRKASLVIEGKSQ